jgi:hypothetical protein
VMLPADHAPTRKLLDFGPQGHKDWSAQKVRPSFPWTEARSDAVSLPTVRRTFALDKTATLWILTVDSTFKPALLQSCSGKSNSARPGRDVIGAPTKVLVSGIQNDGGWPHFRPLHLVERDFNQHHVTEPEGHIPVSRTRHPLRNTPRRIGPG